MFDSLSQRDAFKAHPGAPVPAAAPVAVFLGGASSPQRLESIVTAAGFDIAHADTVSDVRAILSDRGSIAVIVLGALCGGQIDFSACNELSGLAIAPIMVMVDQDDPTNRILALELGADDWATSAYCDRELAARFKALMRRRMTPPGADLSAGNIRFGGRSLNPVTGELRQTDGRSTFLTRTELIMLTLFLRSSGRVVTRAEIRTAMGAATARDRSVVVGVFRLRKKLGEGGEALIRTVRSLGYIFDEPVVGRLIN